MGQHFRQFLHAFSVNSGVILKKIVAEVCVMCLKGVKKILTEVKELRTVFNVFIFCVLDKRCLQNLTISLQVNFYQINFIQWFNESGWSKNKIYAIKPNNLESAVIRVLDFYF